jgi:hypothetical protein
MIGFTSSLTAQSSLTQKTAATNATTTLQLGQRDQPLGLQPLNSDAPGECLKMRVYKVRRDDPQSDSTHRVGYSTCLPAARIRTYRVDQPDHVKMP